MLDDRTNGWAFLPKNSSTTNAVSLEYRRMEVSGRPCLPVRMSILGILICTDPMRRLDPPAALPLWPYNLWEF